tara:strand:- start:7426 stop:9369 length:1944 start_codon:yes stop_codon:yes gene_type:complete
MKYLISIFLITMGLSGLQAQTSEELTQSLALATTDSARVSLLEKICVSYSNSNQDSLMKYTKQLEGYLSNPEFPKVRRLILKYRGAIHMNRGVYDSAIYYFDQERQLAEIENDSLFVIMAYLNMGALYAKIGQNEPSIEILIKALKEIDKTHPEYYELYFHAYNNLAIANQSILKYNESINYARKAYDASKKMQDKYPIGGKNLESMATENLGTSYSNLSQYDSALNYYYKALTLSQELNIPHKTAMIHSYIGNILRLSEGDYGLALDYFQKSTAYFEGKGFSANKGLVYRNLGYLYSKKSDFSKALNAHLIALENFQGTNAFRNEVNMLNDIAHDYRKLGRMNEAFDYLSRHKVLQDSLYAQQMTEVTEEMQVKYETEKKDKDLALQTAQLTEKELELKEQQLLRNAAAAGALSLGIVAFLIYRIKTKSNEVITTKNELLSKSLSEREALLKEIHHRVKNNLQIIASLLYLQSDESEDQDVRRLLEEGQGRVRSMALIHQKLYENDDLKHIPFDDYLKELIGEIKLSFGDMAKNIELEVEAKDVFFDVDTAVPLGLIINELSTNAFKYAYAKRVGGGVFKVVLKKEGSEYRMTVSDNGHGIPDEVLNATQSSSLGLKLTRMLSDQLEGEYNFDNSNGTTFDLKFAV